NYDILRQRSHTQFWPNIDLKPHLALRRVYLNGTEVRDNHEKWRESVISVVSNSGTVFGSGLIVDSNGYIVTTGQTVRGNELISVKLSKSKPKSDLIRDETDTTATDIIKGRVVYIDPLVDLALIKLLTLKPGALVALDFADKSDIKSGQRIALLGYPSGTKGLMTGTISCLDHQSVDTSQGVSRYYQLLLNPNRQYMSHNAVHGGGFTGAPVINMKGKVVGIAIVGYNDSNYAVPVDDVKRKEFEVKDREKRYSFKNRRALGVVLQKEANKGFKVCKFTRNNHFDGKGVLKLNDYITHVDSIEFETLSQLSDTLDGLKQGKSIKLTVERVGQQIPVVIKYEDIVPLDCDIV
ncbi:unnamed protein product, partial [Medioppia subpectinata]